MAALKISKYSFRNLDELIQVHDTPERRAAYIAGDFPRADHVQDLDKRYRWDLFWYVRCALLQDVRDEISTLNDTHLDSALRRIVSPLEPAPSPFQVVGSLTYDEASDSLS